MSETEVHVEHPEHTETLAEEVAEEVQEVLEEVKKDEEQSEAVEAVEEQTEELSSRIDTHSHPEYALAGHTHPELDHSERLGSIESRIEAIERGLEETVEEPVVEEIEPTHEAPAESEKPKRRHRFGR